MPFKSIDLRKVKTYPLAERKNLVTEADLIYPGFSIPAFDSDEIGLIAKRVIQARRNDRQVIWMMGAHVIKSGLGPLIIDLMQKGSITHLAGNGAVGIHDFELALIGETSEDVATSIEDGTFGMAEETGALIHQALREGSIDGLGYGESLGRFIARHEFPHREISLLYHAFRLQIPLTIHVTLGADIIHQHPDCNFGIIGAASGLDFKIFCRSVADLDSGVFLNFGTAVTGPEVFLKAVSITRNLGYSVQGFTTANFDLIPLGPDYHAPVGKDEPIYYYRPRKNIINRPTSLNGEGFHIQGNHRDTIPTLYQAIIEGMGADAVIQQRQPMQEVQPTLDDFLELVENRSEAAATALRNLVTREQALEPAIPALCQAYLAIAACFERGGRLFLFGNGGSLADAQHISGELLKSFASQRPLPEDIQKRLRQVDLTGSIADQLESGLPAVVLGINPVLTSAIDNDFKARWMNIAQELQALSESVLVCLVFTTS